MGRLSDALATYGTQRAAAEALGMARSTYQDQLKAEQAAETGLTVPTFPDDDIPAEQILEQMARRFTKRLKASQAQKWFAIRAQTSEPMGIAWIGDPHLGSNGCNVPLLMRDIDIIKAAPGMVAANIGDTADNWGGRLLRLYAENDVSKGTERRLARWFLREAGIPWMLWLFGNHDEMDGGFTTYLQAINAASIPMLDWRAQFRVTFPNGKEVRIDAAHNHKGHSMWNELHGQERASAMEEPADLYIAGHHHNWAIKQKEMPDGRVVTLARARGYKFIDSHASRHQFFSHQQGATVVTVLDPGARAPTELVRPFADVQEGADFLAWLRARRAA